MQVSKESNSSDRTVSLNISEIHDDDFSDVKGLVGALVDLVVEYGGAIREGDLELVSGSQPGRLAHALLLRSRAQLDLATRDARDARAALREEISGKDVRFPELSR